MKTNAIGPYELGRVHHADCLEAMRLLPDGCVQSCVTSPPYWGLRKYDVPDVVFGGEADCAHEWSSNGEKVEHERRAHSGLTVFGERGTQGAAAAAGGSRPNGSTCHLCGAWRGQLGLEPTPDLYVSHMVGIFREVRRVLRDDGTLWLNIGDCYASTPAGNKTWNHGKIFDGRDMSGHHTARQNTTVVDGLKPKDLIGIPWLLAFALRADGWFLRAEIIWCLSGGAWVYARTQKGDMPMMVKDLVRLDPRTVKLWNGSRWTRATGWRRSADNGDRIELLLRSGERIGCTAEHRWPTQRGDVRARDLVVGDKIATCRLPDADGPVPVYLTDDLCWLAGLYLAEGSHGREDNLRLDLHAGEEWWVPGIEKTVGALGGTVTHRIHGNSLRVRIFGRVVCAAIENIIGGWTAHDKHIRPETWRLPNRCLRTIAKGYLDGDGHDDPGNERVRIGFCRNYSLERDLRTLAARLGATLTLKPCVAKYQGGRRPAFRGEWRWSRSGHHTEKDRGEVVEIRRSRSRWFWDIGVEDEPHLFALASGVLTHNSKTAPMPESVRDRPTRAHEQVFLLSKSGTYFYDHEAASDPATYAGSSVALGSKSLSKGSANGAVITPSGNGAASSITVAPRRNWRTVWTIGPEPNNAQHYAPFPRELARRCIVAGSKAGGVVLDPFAGTGTTVRVADGLGRKAIGFDLGEKYVEQANERSGAVAPSQAKSGQQIGLLGDKE